MPTRLRRSRPSDRSIARLARGAGAPGAALEPLEARIVLSLTGSAPLPDLADMEDPTNPIVRLVTNFGDVDLELFAQDAPGSVQNFLNYVDTGRYDETFAHRFVPGFVVQAGGFGFREGTGPDAGYYAVITDPPIVNEFGRSNTERTLSFAKLGGDPDSATSQFFFNLGDNSANLDNQNGGFTVFARVLDDRSWDVVQQFTMLTRIDLTNAAPPISNPFTDVPVTAAFDEFDPRESEFVYFIDAEVLSPGGTSRFFEQRLVYPEGFRGATDTRVTISNPNTQPAQYQVIARYESGFREEILTAGTLEAHGNITLTYESGLNFVRENTPYSLEIQSFVGSGAFNPQPLSAEIVHEDRVLASFAHIGETFFDTEKLGSASLRNWGFGGLPPIIPDADPNIRVERTPFIVWQNLDNADGEIEVTFYRANADPIVETFSVEARRRGGLAFSQIAGLDLSGYTGARVLSSVDIVASISYYENRKDSTAPVIGSSRNASAWGALGVPQTGSPRGAFPDVRIPAPPADAHILFANPTPTDANVTLTLLRADGTSLNRAILVPSQRGAAFRLDAAALGLGVGESLTAYYSANVPVVAHYAGADNLSATTYARTGAAFQQVATNNGLFAGGVLPNDRLTVFNPATDPGATVRFQVQFHFADGTFGAGELLSVAPFQKIDLDLSALLAEQNNNAAVGVAVVSERRLGSGIVDSTLVLSRTRVDNADEAYATGATLAGPLRSLNDDFLLA